VFLIVVASTLPVIVPFMFMQDLSAAMRISNIIAVAMLAVIGFAYGRASGLSPWWTSASMVLIGGVLVGLTIPLGG
jgi:VIT1/CCC1 family predicted Fe2+/Mn2+ transporter